MALTQTQVSELYVAIFNRASEGSGNEYWQTGTSTADVANQMLATPDAQTYFGDSLDTNQAFIETIYQNTLAKSAADDPEGIAYWVAELESGVSRGQVVANLVAAVASYADSTDPATARAYAQFTNRVEVSDYTAENLQEAPADYATSLNFAADLTVTDDDATVASAQASVDAIVNPEEPATGLTAALNNLSDAQEAETAFLESAPELDATVAVVGGTVDVAAGEATNQNIKDYYDEVAGAVGTDVSVSDFDTRTASVQDSLIAAQEASLSADVDAAAADLPAGQTALLATVSTREEAVVEAFKADNAQLANLDAEIAAFNSANTEETVSGASSFVEFDASASPAVVAPASGEILVMSEAQYDATEDYSPGYLLIDGTIYVGQNATDFADLEAAPRSSQLASAYADKLSSAAAVESAKTALENAVAEVYLSENDAFEVVSDLGSDAGDGNTTVVEYTATAGAEAVSVNPNLSVDVYATEADKNAPIAEVQTIDIVADDIDDDDENITFTYADGSGGTPTVSIDLSATTLDVTNSTEVAAEIASQLNNDSNFANIATASSNSGTLTVTYDGDDVIGTNVAEVLAVTQGAGTFGSTTPTLAGTNVQTSTEGSLDTTSVDAADSGTLATELEEQSDFAELVALFEEARQLNGEILALEEAIEDATAAIENEPDAAEPGLGVTLVDFATATFTADNEVTLFEDSVGSANAVTFTDFGTAGEDQIFFGEGYSLVQIPTGDDIEDSVGDVNTQEILWSQAGGDLTLYVESEAFAGNASSDADVTTIVLNGVTAEDITFEGGFLSAGEVA